MTRDKLVALITNWIDYPTAKPQTAAECLDAAMKLEEFANIWDDQALSSDTDAAWRSLLHDAWIGGKARRAYAGCRPNNRWYIDIAHTVFAAIADDLNAKDEEVCHDSK